MAEVTEQLRSFRSITTSFHKVLECPICLETIKVPFKQCVRGHLMCSSCVKSLTACPTCQGDLSIENPIGVKNLLEALPRFCCFSDKGCTFVVEQGNDHEVFCGFRPVACREFRCQVVVPSCELLKHYESDHPKRCIPKEFNAYIGWPNFIPQNKLYDNMPVYLFETIFWVVINNDVEEKQLKFQFQAMPIGKLLYDYFVRVTLEKENYIYTYTIKASISSSIECEKEEERNEKKCDKTSDNDASDKGDDVNGDVMKIPQRALRHFINKKGSLEYTLAFFRKEIE